MMKKSVQHLQIIHRNDEYGTPQELFNEACEKFNIHPKLDICASKINHVLPAYLTKNDNCFDYKITCDFFMNPEYSNVKESMKFAYEQHVKNNVSGLVLIYAKVDTKWWHNYVEGKAEVHNIKGRIKFNCRHGYQKDNCAPYPSCWVIWRRTKQ